MGKPEELKEGVDYYLDENGLMVFTEAYHLKRGYCCESGCRHCPYRGPATPKTRTPRESSPSAANPPDPDNCGRGEDSLRDDGSGWRSRGRDAGA